MSTATRNGQHHPAEDIVPPHDEDAELSLLGCLIIDPPLLDAVAKIVLVDDFYQPRCGRIFGELLAMARDRAPINGLTLKARLKDSRAMPGMVNEIDFFDIDDRTTNSENCLYYADQVTRKAQQRRAWMLGQSLTKLGADDYRASHDRDAWRAEIEAIPRLVFHDKTEGGIDHGWMSFADFMAQDVRQNYLVDGIVPEAQGGIISGRFKTLKTSIALDLFVSMATGVPFLGKFNVPAPVPCALMTSEAGAASIMAIARRIATAKGIDHRDGPHLTTLRAKMTDPRHLEALERDIERNGWKCVGIDPTYLAFAEVGSKASNVFEMGSALEPVTALIQRTGCSIILLNHNIKGRMKDVARFDPPDLAEISMSGFAEWMRFWLLLAQIQEWDEVTGQHWLWMRTGGSAGHAGLHGLHVTEGEHDVKGRRTAWQLELRDVNDTRREREDRTATSKAKQRERTEAEHERKLLDAINQCPNGETERQLSTLSGLNKGNLATALRSLLKAGRIEPCTVVKNGREWDGYGPKRHRDTPGQSPGQSGTVPPDEHSGTGQPLLEGCPGHHAHHASTEEP